MKQKLISLITLYSLLFSLMVAVPRTVKAQNIVFTVTCSGSATSDTASLNAQITAAGSSTGKIQLPFKSTSSQRCKFNTASIPATLTLDNWIGSGAEIVAGQMLTILGTFTAPDNKQSFFGTGTVKLASQAVHALWFPGADRGIQINTASTALSPNKGTVFASGDFTFATGIVIQENQTLFHGGGVWTPTGYGPVIRLKNGATLDGRGESSVILESTALNDPTTDVSGLVVVASYYGTSSDALNGTIGQNITIRNVKIRGMTPVTTNTASISNGSFTLTDSSAPFTANMVGWTAGVYGASSDATGNLSTVITAFTSSTQVAVATAATVTVTNARLTVAPFNSAPGTISLGNLQTGSVSGVTLENTHTIGILVGGGGDTAGGAGTGTKTITNCTNASPIVCTTSVAHGYTIGSNPPIRVKVASVGGNTAANGYWFITPLTTTTFSLSFSTGNGAYTSGGTAKQLGYANDVRVNDNILIGVASQNVAVTNGGNIAFSNNNEFDPGQPFGPGVAVVDIEPNTNDFIGSVIYEGGQISTANSPYCTDSSCSAKVLHGIAVQNSGNPAAPYGPVTIKGVTINGTPSQNATNNNIAGAAIILGTVSNARIIGNDVKRTQNCIWTIDSTYNHIEGNTCVSTGAGGSDYAIRIQDSSNNSITGNNLYVDANDGLVAVSDRSIVETHVSGTSSNNNTYTGNYSAEPTLLGAGSTIPSHFNTNVSSPKFCFNGNTPCEYSGAGSPEGVITASIGSTYRNTSNGAFYTKVSGSGNTGWLIPTGFSNPMTTTGDLIYASNTAAPSTAARLGIGTAGQCLVVSAGLPSWAACATPTAAGSNTQIQFNNAGAFGADSAFVWDNVNKRLGVGLAAPSSSIEVSNDLAGSDGGVTITQYNTTPGPSLLLRGSRGSAASPSTVLVNDTIGRVLARGYDGVNFGSTSPAEIAFLAGSNFTGSNHQTYTAFYNTPSGSITRAENMRLSTVGLDVAAHSAFGDGATIDQIVGLSGVGPTLINARETITAFDVSWTKTHGIYTQYDINPAGAMPSNYEIYGGQGVVNLMGAQSLAGETIGWAGTVPYSGTNSVNGITGLLGDAQYAGTGATVTQMVGVRGRARSVAAGTTGTINAAFGSYFTVENGIPATMAFARAVAGNIANTSTGAITNAVTMHATTPTNTSGGSYGTIYGVRIEDHSLVGASTAFNFKSFGSTAFNLIEGNLGVGGISTPAGKVDIAGSLNFTALTAPTAITAGTPTGGGSCTAGTHSYKVTFAAVDGSQTTPATTSNIITCVNTTGQTVGLSAIPLGPIGTTSRKIYRTVAGNAGSYLLAGTVSNNTATTFSDTVADGSLGAAAPSSNTTAMANFSTGGTSRAVITSTGLFGINQPAPTVSLHVGGKILSDPQGLRPAEAATAPLHYVTGNPSTQSQGLHVVAREVEVLPNTADPSTYIGGYFSVDSSGGRGGVGIGPGLWGVDIVAQGASVAGGGAITYVRSAEIEVSSDIDTIDDPFGPITGSLSRANAIEVLSITGAPFRPSSAIGILSGGTDGSNWFKTGLYLNRVYSYGLVFNKRADDAISPFGQAMIYADSPTPYVILGGTRTFTNGIDFSASTISTSAFKSSGFNITGAGVLSAASGTFASLTSGRVPIASTSGLLIDDADLTFATDTLTATKFSGPTVGVATNSSAAAGQVGEYITATVAAGSAVSLVTSTAKTVTSISLTAGDWDVTGVIGIQPTATTSITQRAGGASTTDNTLGAFGTYFFYVTPATVPAGDSNWVTPTTRISIASTTTVYLVAYGVFTVDTLKAYGFIRARRVR